MQRGRRQGAKGKGQSAKGNGQGVKGKGQRDSLRAHKGRPNFSEAPGSSEKFGGSIIKFDLRHEKFHFHAAPKSYSEIDEC